MSIGVEFVLKASTAAFTRGMAAAENRVSDLKKSLRTLGGGQLGSAIGIYGIVRGFSSVLRAAQDARAEMEKLGKPIDEATRSVAAYADSIDGLKSGLVTIGVVTLSFFTKAGEGWGMLINRLRGVTREQELNAENIAKQTEETLKATAQFAKDNSAEKILAAEEKLYEFRRKAAIDQAEGADKLYKMFQEETRLRQQLQALGTGTVANREKQLELEQQSLAIAKEIRAQAEATAKVEQQRIELEAKRATAAADVESARAALREQVLGDALPSLQQAAASGGTLGGKARKVLQLEEFAARARGQGASGFESAVKFSTQAAELRQSLQGQIGGVAEDNLTADLSKALTTAEGELKEINKQLGGIFKAQP